MARKSQRKHVDPTIDNARVSKPAKPPRVRRKSQRIRVPLEELPVKVVATLPCCEIDPCKELAVADGSTTLGYYAAMCARCYEKVGGGTSWSHGFRLVVGDGADG